MGSMGVANKTRVHHARIVNHRYDVEWTMTGTPIRFDHSDTSTSMVFLTVLAAGLRHSPGNPHK